MGITDYLVPNGRLTGIFASGQLPSEQDKICYSQQSKESIKKG